MLYIKNVVFFNVRVLFFYVFKKVLAIRNALSSWCINCRLRAGVQDYTFIRDFVSKHSVP